MACLSHGESNEDLINQLIAYHVIEEGGDIENALRLTDRGHFLGPE